MSDLKRRYSAIYDKNPSIIGTCQFLMINVVYFYYLLTIE